LLFSFALVASLILVSCGQGEKSEEQRFEKLQSGIKFRSYKSISGKGLSPLVNFYNKKSTGNSSPIQDSTVRMLLAFTWVNSGKSPWAIAEGQLILEDKSIAQEQKGIAHLLISLALHQEGLFQTAKLEHAKGVQGFNEKNGAQTKEFLMIAYLTMGTSAIKSQDYALAKHSFAGFENLTGIYLPHRIVEIMDDFHSGRPQKGLQKAKKLSQDPNLPKEYRDLLTQTIKEVESQTGSVDSSLFFPRLVYSLILDQLKTIPQWKGLSKLVDQVRDRLSF